MSLIDFVAGCWGGACGVLIGHPLDTIKVRLQTNSENVNLSTLLLNKNQRLGGLFSGLSSPLACLAFVNAIVFGVYGNLNEYLKGLDSTSEPRLSKVGREFIAGTVSGVAQCLVTCPMELVKCRMQITPSVVAAVAFVNSTNQKNFVNSNRYHNYTKFNNIHPSFHSLHSDQSQRPSFYNSSQHRQYYHNHHHHHHSSSSSSSHLKQGYSSKINYFNHQTRYNQHEHNLFSRCSHHTDLSGSIQPTVRETLRAIKRTEKNILRGLYRGMVPTLLRDAPAFGIYFSSFQYLIDRNPEETSETKLLIAGGLAGALSWLFIYPVDVIKTKIQTEGAKYDFSMIKCSKAMYRESPSGWKVFFRGFTPTLIRAFPVNAVTFYVVNKTFVLYDNYL